MKKLAKKLSKKQAEKLIDDKDALASHVVSLTINNEDFNMNKMDLSCLNAKGKRMVRARMNDVKRDMKEHFEQDKWDININSVIEDVVGSVLPAIDWIVIAEVLTQTKNLSVHSKDNGLVFRLTKGVKKK